MSFEILGINHEDKLVDVVFSCDNKKQTIALLPIDDEEMLKESLNVYQEAYIGGLIIEGKLPPDYKEE